MADRLHTGRRFFVFNSVCIPRDVERNQQRLKDPIACVILFSFALILARRKDVTLFAALGFAGLRWAIAAIVTHELRTVIATIIFLGIPILLIFGMLDDRSQFFGAVNNNLGDAHY